MKDPFGIIKEPNDWPNMYDNNHVCHYVFVGAELKCMYCDSRPKRGSNKNAQTLDAALKQMGRK